MEGVGARVGPGASLGATASEEGPVVCSEASLARPQVCPSGGGVWWVSGASAPHPSHRRVYLRMRHWYAMFATETFHRRRAFLPVRGALRKFAAASRLCSVDLVAEGRVCPCLSDHGHRLGCGVSRWYVVADWAVGLYILAIVSVHFIVDADYIMLAFVLQGRCFLIQHRSCQWARAQSTFNLRVRGDSHA